MIHIGRSLCFHRLHPIVQKNRQQISKQKLTFAFCTLSDVVMERILGQWRDKLESGPLLTLLSLGKLANPAVPQVGVK